MATTISGSVLLPDGTIPAHGRVVFQARAPIGADALVLAAPVSVRIEAGTITASLAGQEEGAVYSVTVEHWSDTSARLLRQALPDIVVTGSGAGTLAGLAVVEWSEYGKPYAIKRGDTLSVGCIWLDQNDRPASLADTTVEADMLPTGGGEVIHLTVLVDSDAETGRFSLSLPAEQTADLDTGPYMIDIKYSRNGAVAHSSTGTIIIGREITQ